MEKINIWELNKVHIKPKEEFLKAINALMHDKFKSKEKFYNILENKIVPYHTFRNLLKYSYYHSGYYSPLELFVEVCNKLNISKFKLQENIESYKSANGYNIIEKPILPIKITPIFDMLLAHNIADGNVVNPKNNRQLSFSYRQFDKEFRLAYIKKLESIFGKIKFKYEYFNNGTKIYCPIVLAYLFFNYYGLNSRSFLSKSARLPSKLLNKNKNYLLAVLLAFIIDEGSIDSTVIVIRLKNVKLTKDIYVICKKLGYESTFKFDKEYGSLYIKRKGMKKLFKEYRKLIKKYPEAYMYKIDKKIDNGFKIYNRTIYKTKGNKNLILNMVKNEDLTVNQIAERINMTRQGVRFHIHNLERTGDIVRNGFSKHEDIVKAGFIGRKNIVYSNRGR